MAGVRPGPSTVAGLKWLAKVGPAPLGAWGIAMGWGQAAVYSHARRLRAESWLAMCSRTRGEGSLVYASRTGVRYADVAAAAVEKRPAPVTWPHCEACAWTAAWLTVRGRGMAPQTRRTAARRRDRVARRGSGRGVPAGLTTAVRDWPEAAAPARATETSAPARGDGRRSAGSRRAARRARHRARRRP